MINVVVANCEEFYVKQNISIQRSNKYRKSPMLKTLNNLLKPVAAGYWLEPSVLDSQSVSKQQVAICASYDCLVMGGQLQNRIDCRRQHSNEKLRAQFVLSCSHVELTYHVVSLDI